MRRQVRRQLTIWIIKGELAVLVALRHGLIWALARARSRVIIRQAQEEHYQERLKAAREAHPSSKPFIPLEPTWEQGFPFDFEIMDEDKWAWDDEQRAWYLKDSRETPPEQDR